MNGWGISVLKNGKVIGYIKSVKDDGCFSITKNVKNMKKHKGYTLDDIHREIDIIALEGYKQGVFFEYFKL